MLNAAPRFAIFVALSKPSIPSGRLQLHDIDIMVLILKPDCSIHVSNLNRLLLSQQIMNQVGQQSSCNGINGVGFAKHLAGQDHSIA